MFALMNRFVALWLSIIYLVSSTGTAVSIHYCMGKMAELSLGQKREARDCSTCGMPKTLMQKNGCCSEDEKFLKLQSDQKFQSFHWELLKCHLALPGSMLSVETVALTDSPAGIHPAVHAPPDRYGNDRYKYLRLFLI